MDGLIPLFIYVFGAGFVAGAMVMRWHLGVG